MSGQWSISVHGQSNPCILSHYVQSNHYNTQTLTTKILHLHLNNDGQSITPLHVYISTLMIDLSTQRNRHFVCLKLIIKM